MRTFVTLGNATQPFDRLVRAVRSAIGALPRPVCIQHGATPVPADEWEAIPFMGMDEFSERIRSATLLVMHAGAGSLMHALDAGKVPIVMPRERAYGEHVDDHQLELAEALASTGRIVLIRSEVELIPAMGRALEAQTRPRSRNGLPTLVELVKARLAEYAGREGRPGC